MVRSVVVCIVLLGFVAAGISPCAGQGTVYLVGPDERGEGVLPAATGMEIGTLGEFTVDVYAEDMPFFVGFQMALEFIDSQLAASADFVVAYNHIPAQFGFAWGDRKIVYNDTFLPEIMEVYTAQTFGLLSTEQIWVPEPFPGYWGDPVDKTIPPEENGTAVNPVDRDWLGRTWLMSVTYWYFPSAGGAYTIGTDSEKTVFGDANEQPIPHTIVPGGVTISDESAPSPDPMMFDVPPTATDSTTITMTATTASDSSGVEYLFTETSGNPGAAGSAWQDGLNHTNTGLTAGLTYTYTVTARDKSANQNQTAPSDPASAIPTPDAIPPDPNPMTWALPPAPISGTAISMTADTATDESGAEYYFTETSGNPGGADSGWQDSPTYINSGLTTGLTYCYTATARDKSVAQNQTAPSAESCAVATPDPTPPTPNPMTWASAPSAVSRSEITMTATTASDASGVEYLFTETTGRPGGTSSGWQDSRTYTDTGLTAGTQYTYTVTARDKSVANNMTAPSTPPASATTLPPDTAAPTPNPMTWASAPAIDTSISITMTATTATDESGVEYYFAETSGNPGGDGSGWQDSPAYLDTGLVSGLTYSYTVQARDKSPAQNATTNVISSERSVTLPPTDFDPPDPNPMTWAAVPAATSPTSIAMTATTATDTSGVEYFFTETTGNGHSSTDWQDSPVYENTGLAPGTTCTYTVKARDKSFDHNETGESLAESARTPKPVMYIEGPDDRGEGPVHVGGEFTVDIYAEDIPGFAGFQAALEFALGGPPVNFPIAAGGPAEPFDGLKITWNDAFLPSIQSLVVLETNTFGLVSTEQEWIPDPPPGAWGDYVDKTIGAKTLLMTVTYVNGPDELDGTYSIGSSAAITLFGDGNGQSIPFEVIEGSVTIPPAISVTVEASPSGLGLGVRVDGVDYTESHTFKWGEGLPHTIEAPEPQTGSDGETYEFDNWSDAGARSHVVSPTVDGTYTATYVIADNVPPEPDPMGWAALPAFTSPNSIAMTATTATDPSGVEYYFTETSGNGNDSGWQDSPVYEDTGLAPGTTCTYTAKARDKSVNLNETAESSAESATTPRPIMYIEGPEDRGEGPIDPAGGEFTVDIYGEDMPGFAGFQAALEFLLDGSPANFPIATGGPAEPFDGLKIAWNDTFLPSIQSLVVMSTQTFGLVSTEEEWIPDPPPGHWGDYVDKTIGAKTLLVTVTFAYTTDDVDGTYAIGSVPAITLFGDGNGRSIPFEVVGGSVTIPPSVNITVEASPPGLGLAVRVDGVDYNESGTLKWARGSSHTIEAPEPQTGSDGQTYVFDNWSDAGARSHVVAPTVNTTYTATYIKVDVVDNTPPDPDPMTWAGEPAAVTVTSIAMTATSATDPSGVEYYFDETTGNTGGDDSGWQDSPDYTDTGLQTGTTYTYVAKARDKSTNQNETGLSGAVSVTTPSPKLIIEGPADRGEIPYPTIGGEVTVNIYAQDVLGFAGFVAELDFLPVAFPAPHFAVAYNNSPPAGGAPWGDRKITHNNVFLPGITEFYDGQSYGLTSTEREWIPDPPPGDWGDFVDKSIGAKTLLMSVTYAYTDNAFGDYTIGPDLAATELRDRAGNPIPFSVVSGNFKIGWPIPGDANADCVVNILDLLLVRNKLKKDPYSSDNWKADVNRDRSINVLDMLTVRNALKTACQ